MSSNKEKLSKKEINEREHLRNLVRYVGMPKKDVPKWLRIELFLESVWSIVPVILVCAVIIAMTALIIYTAFMLELF